MTQSVYLYCNPFAKRDKVVVPTDCMNVFVQQLHESAHTVDDHKAVTEILNNLDAGERVYLDEAKHAYFQKVLPLGVSAIEFAKGIKDDQA